MLLRFCFRVRRAAPGEAQGSGGLRKSRGITRRLSLPALAVLAALGLWAATLATATPSTIGVDEIKPGERGYGLTVFRGRKPERFEIEVIDVLHNFRPGQDLVLVRTPHPLLDKAITVAGMSGSPIYVRGRLLGAYAYGWLFGKEPVAGVTPIRSMLSELRRPLRPEIERALRPLGAPPVTRKPASVEKERVSNERPQALTPLLLGGMGDAAATMLKQGLASYGFTVLQAGGGARPKGAAPSKALAYEAGGAVGVQLIRGDISATAVGTVTHVEGSKVLGFGHPFMNVGQLALPASTAKVIHILAAQDRSFKIAEADPALGALVQDRPSTIIVDSRQQARSIPIQIRIRGVPGLAKTQWSMEVASHRLLSPMLILSAVANAVQNSVGDASEVTVRSRSSVDIEGEGTFTTEDVGFFRNGASGGELSDLRAFALSEVAFSNPFRQTFVRSLRFDIEFDFSKTSARIVEAYLPSEEVDPGSVHPIEVRFQSYTGREWSQTFPLRIPETAGGTQLQVSVLPASEVGIPQPEARKLGDMLKAIQAGYPSTSLAIVSDSPLQGMRLRGHVAPRLPGSALHILQGLNEGRAARTFHAEQTAMFPLGQVIVGSARLRLKVREMPRSP